MTVCPDDVDWSQCAEQVKQAIIDAPTAQEAVAAADRWAIRYRRLYDQNAQAEFTPDDAERFEDELKDLVNELVGGWLDPADLALETVLKIYFPRIAAVLTFADSIVSSPFWLLLAPSPIANEFTAATPINDEIGELLHQKLDTKLNLTWRASYDDLIRNAYDKTKGVPLPQP